MQYYELATLTVPAGIVSPLRNDIAQIAKDIDAFASESAGALLGSWVSHFGPQNRIVALRAFETREALENERQRVLLSTNPYGVGDRLTNIVLESYAQFPDLPPAKENADFGPVYEFRTYCLRIGCLMPAMEAWRVGLPARTAISPVVTVMYALDGAPRFTHIWAYRNFDDRQEKRTEAMNKGVWPVKGAGHWLETEMKSEVYMPTPSSRLK